MDKTLPFGVDLAIPQIGGSARKTNHDYTHGHLPELIDIIVQEKPSKQIGVVLFGFFRLFVNHAWSIFSRPVDDTTMEGNQSFHFQETGGFLSIYYTGHAVLWARFQQLSLVISRSFGQVRKAKLFICALAWRNASQVIWGGVSA